MFGSRRTQRAPGRTDRPRARSRRAAVVVATLAMGCVAWAPAHAAPVAAAPVTATPVVGPALDGKDDATPKDGSWVGTWNATPMAPTGLDNTLGLPLTFVNQTVRQVLEPHLSGPSLRIKLSNEYGAQPVTFGDVRVAKQVPGATTLPPGLPTLPSNLPGQLVDAGTLLGAVRGAGTVAGSDRALSFGGRPSVTVPAGAAVYSDPLAYPVTAFQPLTVSFFLPRATGLATQHTIGNQVNYLAPGNLARNPLALGFVPMGISYAFLSDVEVDRPGASSVVGLGDSLTDGLMSTINANHRYPDYLARRLQAAGKNVSAVNQGVAGQRLLFDNIGPSSLNSFDRNVATKPNVKYLIVQVGINDLANPPFIGVPGRHPERISAQQVIDGMKQLIAKARAKGIKVYATTITPSGDLSRPARGLFTTYSLPDVVAKRLAVNTFIRESKAADAVIDFDAVLRDPSNPNSLRPDLASVDNLHPNDAGYEVMADSIDLALFE